MSKRITGLVGFLGVLAALGYAREAGAQSAAVMVLLDRSGSMDDPGVCKDGTSARKWQCALDSIDGTLAMNDTTSEATYFVWELGVIAPDGIAIQHNGSGGTGMTKQAARDLIKTLPGPAGHDSDTPLAGAYCGAVKFLDNLRNNVLFTPALPLYMRLESDGLENATPLGNDCKGDDSGTGTNFTPTPASSGGPVYDFTTSPGKVDGLLIGSWQSRMYDVGLTGKIHPYPPDAAFNQLVAFHVPAGKTAILQNAYADFIDDFIQSAFFKRGRAPSDASLLAVSTPVNGPSTVEDLVNFLGGMSKGFNGRLTRFGSGVLPPAGDPYAFHDQAGDVNDDGCVNSADYAFIQQLYGQKVSSAVPNTFRADANLDGIVGSEDYLVLAANYGMGCSQSAGPLPPLNAGLLGFEFASSWSSPQTALAVTAVAHTEGAFSLKVGTTGWREVKSVNFPTSAFGGVKAKLAFDVFVPGKPVNPAWLGQTLAFISIPSAGINNVALGAVELTGKPTNAFTTTSFTLPANVKTALGQVRTDVSLRLVINSSDKGHLFDNVRLTN